MVSPNCITSACNILQLSVIINLNSKSLIFKFSNSHIGPCPFFVHPLVAVLSTRKFALRKSLLLIWFLMEIPLFMLYAEKKFINCYYHTAYAFVVSPRDLGI